jgi:hypothetical protein
MYRLNSQHFQKGVGVTTTGPQLTSAWTLAVDAGVVPTTPAIPDNTTTGAINKETTIGTSGYVHVIARSVINGSSGVAKIGLADRLSHQGGLSANDITTQTTNLPTAALTRYTDGVGVMAAIELFSTIGTTQTTVTVSYTNQDGVSGRTSQPMLIGGTGYRDLNRMIMIMPQNGDYGFHSVESVTLAGSTAGASTNIGVVLFKPLYWNHAVAAGIEQYGTNNFNNLIGSPVQFEQIAENACLYVIGGGNTGITLNGSFQFMETS